MVHRFCSGFSSLTLLRGNNIFLEALTSLRLFADVIFDLNKGREKSHRLLSSSVIFCEQVDCGSFLRLT